MNKLPNEVHQNILTRMNNLDPLSRVNGRFRDLTSDVYNQSPRYQEVKKIFDANLGKRIFKLHTKPLWYTEVISGDFWRQLKKENTLFAPLYRFMMRDFRIDGPRDDYIDSDLINLFHEMGGIICDVSNKSHQTKIGFDEDGDLPRRLISIPYKYEHIQINVQEFQIHLPGSGSMELMNIGSGPSIYVQRRDLYEHHPSDYRLEFEEIVKHVEIPMILLLRMKDITDQHRNIDGNGMINMKPYEFRQTLDYFSNWYEVFMFFISFNTSYRIAFNKWNKIEVEGEILRLYIDIRIIIQG